MQLDELVSVSETVAATRSRLKKRAALSQCLRACAPRDIPLAVSYLTGTLPQGRIGIGPSLLQDVSSGEAPRDSAWSLQEIDQAFGRIAALTGSGSQAARREELGTLFACATFRARAFLTRLMLGELRQGALEGVLIDAIADVASVPASDVRRAVMLAGAPAVVAGAAMRDGAGGLSAFRLTPFTPIQPMLAQPAETIEAALASFEEAALEHKLDGARVQIHKVGQDVRVFSRGQNDVTSSLPEVVEFARNLDAAQVILDGEVIALRPDGRPHPFQDTMRRFGRKAEVERMRGSLPLSVFVFDSLHRDGTDLIDMATKARFEIVADTVPPEHQIARIVTSDLDTAKRFFRSALSAGHEGVMAKSLTSAYAAGNRGAAWLKLKQAHTLDLVVLAAEWGTGRREGYLSNLHLGARDAETDQYVMLGKTFKGLTDGMLRWQTEQLLQFELGREDQVVHVRPELVAEIAVNEIQASTHYPAGMALRFARVKRYREDKRPSDADTLDTVRALFNNQP